MIDGHNVAIESIRVNQEKDNLSKTNTGALSYSIAAVERETGLSKDVLRVWERRYGFPAPQRDTYGERVYPHEQVERLRLIKRLLDQGHRPGRLLGMSLQALHGISPRNGEATAPSESAESALDTLLEPILAHDAHRFTQQLQQRLAREGLQKFVQDTIAPLTTQVGLAWERGAIQVFEEHLYSELVQRLLRHAIGPFTGNGLGPRVVLATAPGEQHELGLLMVEALLSLDGATCIPLGTQVPLGDLGQAAIAHRADVLALSFSSSFNLRATADVLRQLRSSLPAEVELWAGGSGCLRCPSIDGVQLLAGLQDGREQLLRWRDAHAH